MATFCKIAVIPKPLMLLTLLFNLAPLLHAQVELDRLETQDEEVVAAAAQEALAKFARDMTRQSGRSQQSTMQQDSIVFNRQNNTLLFYFTLHKEAFPERNFYLIKYNEHIMKEHISNAFINADKSIQQIPAVVEKARGSLGYVFYREGMEAKAVLTPDEVAQLATTIQSGGGNSYTQRLQKAVDDLNRQLPRPLNNNIVMDSATLDKHYLTYHCSLATPGYNLSVMVESGRQNMEHSIRNRENENSITLIQQLVASNRGFRMTYYDPTNNQREEYTFTPAELKAML